MNQTTPAHSGPPAGNTAAPGAMTTGGSIGAKAVRAPTASSVGPRVGPDFSDVVELSRRRPVPQLLLPIVGPAVTPQTLPPPPPSAMPRPSQDIAAAAPPDAGLVRSPSVVLTTPSAAFERSVVAAPARESLAMDVFGFALAWVMTTAAGSLVFGHVMARSQPPVVVQVPDVARAAVDTPEPQVSCPKSSWEPPLVAVSDLPAAPQSHWLPQRALAVSDAPAAPIARPARQPQQDTVRHPPPPSKVLAAAPVRRGRFSGAPAQSAGKAKTSPKTLEEWMRAAVDPG